MTMLGIFVGIAAVVSLGIYPELNISVADGICKGLKKIADRFGVSIVGGDMAKSKKIVLDVSLIGEAKKENLALRSAAKAGDVIFVTGLLGGSIKGRHLNFMPRLEEIQSILKSFKVNAMIDISDGLALDLWRIAEASGVGAYLYEDAIPVSGDAVSVKNALYDGEDYELLFTMTMREAKRFFKTMLAKFRIPVTPIGKIVDRKRGYKIIRQNGKLENLKIKGYLHF